MRTMKLHHLVIASMASHAVGTGTAPLDTVLKELDNSVVSSPLLQHDLLTNLASGAYGDMNLAYRIFAANHYVYSRNFARYLQIVLDKVSDEQIGAPIEENMAEEDGNYEEEDLVLMEQHGIKRAWFDKIPHKLLSKRFIEGVGLKNETVSMDSPGGRFTNYMIDMYGSSTACEALAVIGFAIEQTVSTMYQFVWDGLRNHTTYDDETIVFFPLHILVDDGHAELLRESFIKQFNKQPTTCTRSADVVKAVLERRVQMFDEVHRAIVNEVGWKKQGTVDVADAVERAKRQTASMSDPQWSQLYKMTLAARILSDAGHGDTLAGQLTCRDTWRGRPAMWTTRYGQMFGEMTEKDFILVDENLDVQRGEGFPNMATRFHLHVYQTRPDINCIVHTHPPAVSALGLTGKKLEVEHMDVMAFYDDVQLLKEWPGIPFGDEEGKIISSVLAPNHHAALLAHHGLIVTGSGDAAIEQATYRAWFFEYAARMQLDALSANGGRDVTHVRADIAKKARDWRINDGPVRAHFNAWARKVLRAPEHHDLKPPTMKPPTCAKY